MARTTDPAELFDAAVDGDRGALARLLSMVERGGEPARRVGRMSHPRSGSAYTVGITGAPGSGKSTLTSALLGHLRSMEIEVAVLAIDPSSPFTGGAILGDRVRMQEHATDAGVFIRSMATRGHLGGLSLATPEAVRLLDAVGRRWILLETVGVGQVEVEVAGKADTTVVVVNPGWGDSVQANKAGLMEIADVFVINKADRKGVDETRRDLEQMLDLSELPSDAWRPPIVPTVAPRAEGVPELWEAVSHHRAYAESSGQLQSASRLQGARGAPRDRRQPIARTCPRDLHGGAVGGAHPGRRRARIRSVDGRRHDARRCAGTMIDAMSDDAVVRLERNDDGVAVVTLANGKVNALSGAVVRALHEVADALTADPPGAVVITGGDRIFAAGADISEFGGADEAAAITAAIHGAVDAVAAIPRMVIAAVTGYALGGGCELALACDYRVAGKRAVFGQPEILLGTLPGGGGTQRLARLVGPSRAKELCLTGRQVAAEEALRIGLADEVVPNEEVHARALALAAECARRAVLSQAFAKRAIDEGLSMPLTDGAAARAGAVHRVVPNQRQPGRRQELPRARPRQGQLHGHLRGSVSARRRALRDTRRSCARRSRPTSRSPGAAPSRDAPSRRRAPDR